MRSSSQKTRDLVAVTEWRQNLLRLVTEGELAFRIVESDATYAHGDEAEWLMVLEQRKEKTTFHSGVLLGNLAMACGRLERAALEGHA